MALFLLLSACGSNEKKVQEKDPTPVVTDNGQTISFPDPGSLSFFKTEQVSNNNLTAEFTAPAKISATVISSGEGAIVLFENPELAGSYTLLMQHRINISQINNINIKQRQLELSRTKELQAHGAATGQDLLNAQTALSMEQTNLANEKAALVEHEAKLIAAGFEPEVLQHAKAGTAYLVCDIPENQISRIKEGQPCNIVFTAFPDENFVGKIDAVADMVDNITRMIKVRISIKNPTNRLKSGMFASVSFGLSEDHFINISNASLITVQGKSYVFVKKSDNTFERREIQVGQQIGNRVLVFGGLNPNENIAVEGVMQLKGLSFGY
ncbi:efflux RND transporter periplasmic adaptor subunit [Fluviicola sp.]|uniref:efflux RND transporter periplasmic adaptor subunit n=1 Tax=Fluviicola sp. TaxID=1917219 RepID=UPI0031E33D4E